MFALAWQLPFCFVEFSHRRGRDLPELNLALGVDQRHDFLVDRSGEHHLDDLDGLFVGDPQPALESRLDAHLGQHGADLRPAATGGAVGVPDLSVANLTAVAFRTSDNGEVMHYAGQNGCRLTYFRGASVFPESSDTPGQQIATWLSGDHLRHIVVATGMDRTRFDAIASYLMLETRERVSESVMASLSEATRTARSCVG